eukprot:CAMPEP_0202979342 /NCGR_PEP_ID=MMETSP1396-20130829/85523_1 /ASSEMBLY_ACC=CAM_ASM_000872 /TAXON_ID= /ORGANISM="Pseudokeronopsis sp., Strain Brazil" /LENGTH=186 /DNA_ID=CAMNT_0049718733 /DNA_START=1149 /DNA_END=1709 /DNA_ORIENTATION=-
MPASPHFHGRNHPHPVLLLAVHIRVCAVSISVELVCASRAKRQPQGELRVLRKHGGVPARIVPVRDLLRGVLYQQAIPQRDLHQPASHTHPHCPHIHQYLHNILCIGLGERSVRSADRSRSHSNFHKMADLHHGLRRRRLHLPLRKSGHVVLEVELAQEAGAEEPGGVPEEVGGVCLEDGFPWEGN